MGCNVQGQDEKDSMERVGSKVVEDYEQLESHYTLAEGVRGVDNIVDGVVAVGKVGHNYCDVGYGEVGDAVASVEPLLLLSLHELCAHRAHESLRLVEEVLQCFQVWQAERKTTCDPMHHGRRVGRLDCKPAIYQLNQCTGGRLRPNPVEGVH